VACAIAGMTLVFLDKNQGPGGKERKEMARKRGQKKTY